MDPLTLLALGSTAASGLGMLFNKRKSFSDTAYGKKLRELSARGVDLAPVIGAIGKETGAAAQQAKTALKGRLISRSMGGSIAGQSSISGIDVKRMDQLQRSLKDLQFKNEQLKTQYGLQYTQATTAYDTANQEQTQNALSDMFGVSGSLLYNQLDKGSGSQLDQLYEATRPTRPDMPLEAPEDYVMPIDTQGEDYLNYLKRRIANKRWLP